MVKNPDTPVEGPPLTARPQAEIQSAQNVQNGATVGEPDAVEAHEEEHPTDSHALAHMDHEEKGVAQMDHGQTEVRDLGWNEHPTEVPVPLVGGLPNEELWTLIRRFNKVRYYPGND
jgi:hypothetical protein